MHALRGRDIHTGWRRTGKLYTPISCNRFIREKAVPTIRADTTSASIAD